MDTTKELNIDRKRLDSAYTYDAYRELVVELVEKKMTSGPKQHEDLAHYTEMNNQRMKRVDKTTQITESLAEEIKKIKEPQTWILLTESWCGDAAYNVPVINKLAALNDLIELKLFFRDENADIMDRYLTNGGRSIPKLVIFPKDSMKELGTWGPRPAELQVIYDDWKNDPNKVPYKEFNVTIQKWYAKNKGVAMQTEIEELFKQINK